MFINKWSPYEALRRILGLSKEELSGLCGSDAKLRHGALSESHTSKRIIRVFDKLMRSFDENTQKDICVLRDALMTTNCRSVTARKRSTSLGNFMQAMGYTQSEFAEIMKVNEGSISKAVNNRGDKSDELYEKIESWLKARYSVLSDVDQKKVDTLKAALDISGCVILNPYRKELIEKGILGGILPKPELVSKEVEDLKEYIKLLEEENETLRDRVEELKEENESLNNTNARQMNEIAAMNDEIMDLNRELETHNTANAGLQDGVTDLNQKIDELEAKTFRLEEEKEALISMNENLGNGVSPFKFENCIVNIYTKEDI